MQLCRAQAQEVTYKTPSSKTAANCLDLLSSMSELVPDLRNGTVLEHSPIAKPTAATVSYAVLDGILAGEALGLRPYEVRCVTFQCH